MTPAAAHDASPAAAAERFEIPGSCEVLFKGWAAGHYDLPDALVGLAGAFRQLTVAEVSARQLAAAARDVSFKPHTRARAVQELVRVIVDTGSVPPDPEAPLVAELAAAEHAQYRAELLGDVRTKVQGQVEGKVRAAEPALVSGPLRTAFAAILADVGELAPALRAIRNLADPDRDLATAGPATRAAFLRLTELRARLDAILAAQQMLLVLVDGAMVTGEAHDPRGWFPDTKAEPLGDRASVTLSGFALAGPEDPLERLRWLATNPDASPALSTAAERYALWVGIRSRPRPSQRPVPPIDARAQELRREGATETGTN